MRWIRYVIMAASLVLVIYCGWNLWAEYSEVWESSAAYEDLQTYVSFPAPQATDAVPEQPAPTDPTEEADSIVFPKVDFDGLREINDTVVGWIYAQDGEIDLPVAQASNNSYYLSHLFDDTPNSRGCIFLECTNSPDFSDDSSIIYGHHLRAGSMFSTLEEYKEPGYPEEHPYVLLMTPETNYAVRIFAGYVATVNDPAWEHNFQDRAQWAPWMAHILESSVFEPPVLPDYHDHILVLTTCSNDFYDARFVLFGIMEPHEVG